MERTWTDKRDGLEWEIEAIPMMRRMEPGDRIPMIGETPYTIWFRRPGQSHQVVVDPDVGSRLEQLTDDELQALLDEGGQHHVRVDRG